MGRESNNGECPFLLKKERKYGQFPYECQYNGREISVDEYFHLCRSDQLAIKRCPMRKRDYEV